MGVLPKPKDIAKKSEASATSRAASERIGQYAKEEAKLVRSINDKRAELEKVTRQARETSEAEQEKISVKNSILRAEVLSLEERRREAEKPLTDKMKAIEKAQNDVRKETNEMLRLKRQNELKAVELLERESKVKSSEESVAEKNKTVDARFNNLTAAEEELHEQISNFGKERAKKLLELKDKEAELDKIIGLYLGREAALKISEERIASEEKRLADLDRRLKDGYRNLEAAAREIKNKT